MYKVCSICWDKVSRNVTSCLDMKKNNFKIICLFAEIYFMSTVCSRTVYLSRESVGFANAQASIQSISSCALETVQYKGSMGLSKLCRVLECLCSINFTNSCLLLHRRHHLDEALQLRFWACQSHLEGFTRVQCNHGSMVLILPFF